LFRIEYPAHTNSYYRLLTATSLLDDAFSVMDMRLGSEGATEWLHSPGHEQALFYSLRAIDVSAAADWDWDSDGTDVNGTPGVTNDDTVAVTGDYTVELLLENGGVTALVETASVAVDLEPPDQPRVTIAGHADGVGSRDVELRLYYDYATYEMTLSNDGIEYTNWFSATRKVSWTLADGEDGLRTVFVKARDEVGNESSVGSETIFVDTSPPSNFVFTVNSGSATTVSRFVELRVYAEGGRTVELRNEDTLFWSAELL